MGDLKKITADGKRHHGKSLKVFCWSFGGFFSLETQGRHPETACA